MKFIFLLFLSIVAIFWLFAFRWWIRRFNVSKREAEIFLLIWAYIGAIVGGFLLIY